MKEQRNQRDVPICYIFSVLQYTNDEIDLPLITEKTSFVPRFLVITNNNGS